MPAHKNNRYAAKHADKRASASLNLRAPVALKQRAVRAASARNMKLSPWLLEAIAEKCEKEIAQ